MQSPYISLHLNLTSLPKKAAETNGQVCFKLSILEYYFVAVQVLNTCVFYCCCSGNHQHYTPLPPLSKAAIEKSRLNQL